MYYFFLIKVGVEFDHIENEVEKYWLYENYESIMSSELTKMELINSFKILLPGEVIIYLSFTIFLYNLNLRSYLNLS